MRLDWIRPNHDCIIQLGMRIFWECVRCAESPFVLETGSRAERDGGPWGDSDTRAEAESDLSRHCGAKDTPLQTILTRITTHTRRTTKYLLFESNSTITNNLNKIHFWNIIYNLKDTNSHRDSFSHRDMTQMESLEVKPWTDEDQGLITRVQIVTGKYMQKFTAVGSITVW